MSENQSKPPVTTVWDEGHKYGNPAKRTDAEQAAYLQEKAANRDEYAEKMGRFRKNRPDVQYGDMSRARNLFNPKKN